MGREKKQTIRALYVGRNRKDILRFGFVLVFAILTTVVIIHIHAATTVTSFEAENGTLSGNASLITGPNQSGGKAVKFNAATGGGGCTISPILVNSCHPWFGGRSDDYPAAASQGVLDQQLYAEQRLGRTLDIYHTYNTPGDILDSVQKQLATMHPNSYLFANWKPANDFASAGGGNASVNADIDAMADSIKSIAPKKMFLTVWHEPQNNVSSGATSCGSNFNGYKGTSGTPAQYRAMWQNVRNRFNAKGITNVVWVIDFQNYPPLMCMIDDLYPGDNLVDWVMNNAYGGPPPGNQNFKSNIDNFYDYYTSHSNAQHNYLSKPWGIVEWGDRDSTTAEGSDYYAQAKALLDSCNYPKLNTWMYFDAINTGHNNMMGYDYNNNNPFVSQAKQNAFNAFANDPMFTSTTPVCQ